MRYIHWLNRVKYVVVLVGMVFVAVAAWFAGRMDLNPSLEARFIRDSGQLAAYKEFQEGFGGEPLLLVVWAGPNDVWEPQNISRIKELARKIETIDGVESVISVATLPGIDDSTAKGTDVETLKKLPLVRKLLVDNEARRAVLVIMPEHKSIYPSPGLLLVNNIKDLLNNFTTKGERAFVTGPLAMQSQAIEFSRIDLWRTLVIVVIVALLLFGFIYRGWQSLSAAFLVAAISLCGACGIISLIHLKLSQWALMALPVLAAISLQDVLHLLEHYRNARSRGADTLSACRTMLTGSAIPCVWTTLTTMVGFAALLISDIEQIRSIGLVVVVGAPLALGASLMVVPAILLFAPLKVGAIKEGERRTAGIFTRHLVRRAPLWTGALIIFTLVCAYGVRFAQVSLDFPKIFRSDVLFQKQFEEVDEKLSGGASFEITMETQEGENFASIDKLQKIASLQTALSLIGPVAATVSPLDVGLTAYVIKHGIPTEPAKLRKGASALITDMRSSNSSPLAGWLSADLKRARVHVRVRAGREKYHDRLLTTLFYLRDGFQEKGVAISWSGFSLLYKEMEKRMVHELLASFGLAFVGVLIFLIILFRSVKWGFLAMIPNILPVAITVGIMGWVRVGFSLGLIILPAVGLGLIVDDTIHVVWWVRRYLKSGANISEAMAKVLSTTGRALIFSTIILAAGFASLAVSPFISNIQLALFMPLLLILALIFDLIAVPVVLVLKDKFYTTKRHTVPAKLQS